MSNDKKHNTLFTDANHIKRNKQSTNQSTKLKIGKSNDKCMQYGNMDQRGHIPHPRKGKSIDDQGFATKRQRTRTAWFENMVPRFNMGTPVIAIQILNTHENTQNLNLRGWPLEGDRRVGTTTPAPQPKTLRLSLIQLGPRGSFKKSIGLKNCFDGVVAGNNKGHIIRILWNRRERGKARNARTRNAGIAADVGCKNLRYEDLQQGGQGTRDKGQPCLTPRDRLIKAET